MSEEVDRVATRVIVRANDDGFVTLAMFNKAGEELGVATFDTETAREFVDELDEELEGLGLPKLATMRCLGTG